MDLKVFLRRIKDRFMNLVKIPSSRDVTSIGYHPLRKKRIGHRKSSSLTLIDWMKRVLMRWSGLSRFTISCIIHTIWLVSPQDPSSPLISIAQKLRRQWLSVVIWHDIGDWIRERLLRPIIPWPESSQSEALHSYIPHEVSSQMDTRDKRAFVFDTNCLLNSSTSLMMIIRVYRLFLSRHSLEQYFFFKKHGREELWSKVSEKRSLWKSLRWIVNMRTDRTDPYRYDCRASTLRFHTNNILI